MRNVTGCTSLVLVTVMPVIFSASLSEFQFESVKCFEENDIYLWRKGM